MSRILRGPLKRGGFPHARFAAVVERCEERFVGNGTRLAVASSSAISADFY
jgi:hypothetical protein